VPCVEEEEFTATSGATSDASPQPPSSIEHTTIFSSFMLDGCPQRSNTVEKRPERSTPCARQALDFCYRCRLSLSSKATTALSAVFAGASVSVCAPAASGTARAERHHQP